ncbi:mannose-1-phosphate guanylyltransferase [bacterium]|nr:mannose-1-phosphate guanylyltransferase [candidate division CSSED10-310 bacterium]
MNISESTSINNLYIVIMAGGKGTRFWPESRSHYPKQFLKIVGEDSMIRQTYRRVAGIVAPDHIFVVTGDNLISLIREHTPEIPEENILLEPVGRNTAPCVAWASSIIEMRDPGAVLAILASDHAIEPTDAFQAQMTAAASLALTTGKIVTLGIPPDRPETGYGYLQMGQMLGEIDDLSYSEVLRFIEKPDRLSAERYLQEGGYLWNSGMFVFSAARMLQEIESHQPEILEGIVEIVESGNDRRIVQKVFPDLPSVSIDVGVMERTRGILGMPVNFDWSDVGSWQSLYEHIPADDNGNYHAGQCLFHGCKRVLGWSRDRLIVGIGLEDIIIVETPDALLVCRRDLAQQVGEIPKMLERSGQWKRYI